MNTSDEAVDKVLRQVARHRYQPGDHGGCIECGLTPKYHLTVVETAK